MSADNAFQDAVARAKKIAEKLAGAGGGAPEANGHAVPTFASATMKRQMEDMPYMMDGTKRFADAPFQSRPPSGRSSGVGAGIPMAPGPGGGDDSDNAKAVAAAVAARINASLGFNGGGGLGGGQPPMSGSYDDFSAGFGGGGGMGQPPNSGSYTEDFFVPDRMVGLLIGKGGETISKIQQEAGAKLQIDQEHLEQGPNGPQRRCTMTGSMETVQRLRSIVQSIVEKGKTGGVDSGNLPYGHVLEEMLVPGNKVGSIIGKGGEHIKRMQEECQVKMVLIQDTTQASNEDKPLRISGLPDRVQQAKARVVEVLSQFGNRPPGGGGGGYGGDQFGGSGGGGYGGDSYGQGGGGGGFGRGQPIRIEVPNNVVGAIIGKGGDNIRKLSTDYNVKLQFNNDQSSPNQQTKSLEINGPPECVQAAGAYIKQMLDDMLAGRTGPGSSGGSDRGDRDRDGPRGGPPGGFGGYQGGGEGRGGGGGPPRGEQVEVTMPIPHRKAGYVIGKQGSTIQQIKDDTGAYIEVLRTNDPEPMERIFKVRGSHQQVTAALNMMAEKSGCPPPPGWGGGGAPAPAETVAYPHMQQYAGGYQPQPPQHPGAPPAWEQQQQQQYYQQYYQQGQPAAPQQPYGYGQPVAPQPPAAAPQPTATPTPTVNPVTGQPDYSEAWATYYRSLGHHAYADAILAQAKGGPPAGPAPTGPADPAQPTSAPSSTSQYSGTYQAPAQPAAYSAPY